MIEHTVCIADEDDIADMLITMAWAMKVTYDTLAKKCYNVEEFNTLDPFVYAVHKAFSIGHDENETPIVVFND